MNIKQKLYLITLTERSIRPILEYLRTPPSECKGIADKDMRDALRMSDIQVDPEKKISKLEGACEVLGLTPIFDKVKGEIRICNKKNRVLLWTNGEESNYDFDKLAMDYCEKYGCGSY